MSGRDEIDKRLIDALQRASAIVDIHSNFAIDCQNALSDYNGEDEGSHIVINKLAQNVFEAGKLVHQWASICRELREALALSEKQPDPFLTEEKFEGPVS